VLSADVIPPGGEGEIKVTLTPKGGLIKIHKQIVVISDDPETPRFALTMKGELLLDVQAKPSRVNLPEIRIGEPATTTVSFVVRDPEATTLTGVELEDDTHFELRALDTEGEDYELRFRGSKTLGVYSTRIEAKTTNPHTPEVQIPVRVVVVSNLRYGKRVRFIRKNGEIATRRIQISGRDGSPPQITKISDPAGLLEFKIGEPRGAIVHIAASVDMSALEALDEHERSRERKLTVFTKDRHEPSFEIVYVIVDGASKSARGRPTGLATELSTGGNSSPDSGLATDREGDASAGSIPPQLVPQR